MDRDKLFKLLPWISTPLLVIAIIGIWKLGTSLFEISRFVLPPPEDVGAKLVELVGQRDIWLVHARTTLAETLAGFAFALAAGVFVGAVLGRVLWLERAVRPVVVTLQVIPKVALIPLFVIWFGFGMTSKIIVAAILAFFPIMLNVLLGVRSVDRGHREVMRSLDATRWQTFASLDFHSTLPYVFAGMEVGIVFALIGAIVGEYIGGNHGLGYMVVVSLNALDAPTLFAVIVLLAALGSLLFFAVNLAKRWAIPWHESATTRT
ncbi:MAG TPA: ABC transporter permease [Gammaproteobacteria bacterium]|nr:ABC transporter permease [Gammaproteobacteria bacterium]